jgi:hypothetical protein
MRELRTALPGEATVEVKDLAVVAVAHKNVEVENLRQELDGILSSARATARITVWHRKQAGGDWAVTAGPYRAPRTRHRGRSQHGDRGRPLLSRKAKLKWLCGMGLAAVAGVTYYALAPGVASYQAAYVLVFPILVTFLVWLHRRLPTTVQWTISIALAVTGPLAYLVFGGSQWWYWGQMAVLPLILLAVGRSASRSSRVGPPKPWYGGHMEGPWGPP